MRSVSCMMLFLLGVTLLFFACQKSPQENLAQFNKDFFAKHVPEFPAAQLMTKSDIPSDQQEFFDEAKGKLQLLIDLNNNNIPEYILCGFSATMVQQQEKGAYFVAIFEQTNAGIKRLYLNKLFVAPVTLEPSDDANRKGVVISFAFFSEYAAEIYFENNEYHLQKLF